MNVGEIHVHVDKFMYLAISLVRPSATAPIGDAGVLVRSALDDAGQQALYKYLCAAAASSREWSVLADSQPRQRPWPLAIWRHPYTEETNAALSPSKVFSWSSNLARRTSAALRSPHREVYVGKNENEDVLRLCLELEMLECEPYDSMVSLLYDSHAVLPEHIDDGLRGLGLSVSLGASATFAYGEQSICLRSGDALFGRFGLVQHQVASIHGAETAPMWWQQLPTTMVREEEAGASAQGDGSNRGHVDTANDSSGSRNVGPMCAWGRARCNVQLRHGRDGEARRERRERARREQGRGSLLSAG